MPKITVVMGVYNTLDETMLIKSINSIIEQSFEDFEYIICDDGSTDSTYEILEKISKKDKRIKLIKNEKNLGLAAALNNCIINSTGKYIARQDADDYSSKYRFEKQISFLESNKEISFVGSNMFYFNSSQIWGEYRLPKNPKKEDFLFRVPFMHATLMMRKNDIIKSGMYTVNKYTARCEDYDLFMKMYANRYIGSNIQENLYYCREDEAALSRRKFKYRFHETIVRYKGFKKLGLLPKGYIYILKPLLVGLTPNSILNMLKNFFYRRSFK